MGFVRLSFSQVHSGAYMIICCYGLMLLDIQILSFMNINMYIKFIKFPYGL
jgi:hypothetical protein